VRTILHGSRIYENQRDLHRRTAHNPSDGEASGGALGRRDYELFEARMATNVSLSLHSCLIYAVVLVTAVCSNIAA
jgi:hypothetical protein